MRHFAIIRPSEKGGQDVCRKRRRTFPSRWAVVEYRICDNYTRFYLKYIQTRKGAYIVEIKRRGHIGEDVVDEVERKVSALKVSLDKSIRTVLVYDGELSKRVPADAFFSFIISSDILLGKGTSLVNH